MQNAAVAGIYGWDVMALLALDDDDFAIASTVLAETHRMAGERQLQLLDHVANKTSNQILSGFGRIVARALKSFKPK